MTCIVAVSKNNKVYMGGDSCAVDDTIITTRTQPKVFIKNEVALGFCHSFRLGQILEYFFEPPPVPETQKNNLLQYMVTIFIPKLRQCLEDHQYPYHEDEKDNWSILVGIKGELFYIESDWQVGQDKNNYYAVGSGAEYALGAMYSCSNLDPNAMLLVGLNAAKEFSPFVREPFNFIVI